MVKDKTKILYLSKQIRMKVREDYATFWQAQAADNISPSHLMERLSNFTSSFPTYTKDIIIGKITLRNLQFLPELNQGHQ